MAESSRTRGRASSHAQPHLFHAFIAQTTHDKQVYHLRTPGEFKQFLRETAGRAHQ